MHFDKLSINIFNLLYFDCAQHKYFIVCFLFLQLINNLFELIAAIKLVYEHAKAGAAGG